MKEVGMLVEKSDGLKVTPILGPCEHLPPQGGEVSGEVALETGADFGSKEILTSFS
mgnify:CR=1 FL=1